MTTSPDVRIFFCTMPTNMHYSFDGLMGQAQAIFDQDPTSGHLFLFLNRGRDRIKILFWDGKALPSEKAPAGKPSKQGFSQYEGWAAR